jgi:cell division protein FtsW
MKKKQIDYILFFIVIVLLAIGITMVFSSSYYYALNKWNDKFRFLKKEIVWAAIGMVGMLISMNIPYKFYKYLSWPMTVGAAGLLVATTYIGDTYNGAQRWITLLNIQFMPSELAKFALIIFFAHMLSSRKYAINRFRDLFIPYIPVLAIFTGLIMVQPDYSTTVLLLAVVVSMIFVSGANLFYTIPFALVGIFGGWYYIKDSAYRYQRFLTFLNPFEDPMNAGWQIVNSLYALGSGGLLGVGLGQSSQNKLYIPEPQNDFILATLGEETGFVGSMGLILLFVILVFRGIKIAKEAPDAFGSLLAYGITILVAFQAIINIGVATSSMPVTGMPLPFISYGGTSLAILMFMMGILLNISRYSADEEEAL